MSLRDKIFSDIKTAMKSGETQKLSTLRMVSASLINKEKDKRAQAYKNTENHSIQDITQESMLTDSEVLEVIQSEAKKRKDAIEQYDFAGETQRSVAEQAELAILSAYLPKQMTEEEVRQIIDATIAEISASGIQDMGKVMGAIMPKVKGKADGGLVNKLVMNALQKLN